jgi:hypothetical protein
LEGDPADFFSEDFLGDASFFTSGVDFLGDLEDVLAGDLGADLEGDLDGDLDPFLGD